MGAGWCEHGVSCGCRQNPKPGAERGRSLLIAAPEPSLNSKRAPHLPTTRALLGFQAAKLRAEEGCDFVIALTHFREPNDERLAAEAPEIDIVLGGHDHHYAKKQVQPTGTWYVKSGADFKYLSKIDMHVGAGGVGRGEVHVEKLEVDSAVPEDTCMKAIADHYLDNLKAAMGRELGRLGCDVDARFAIVRTQETNCGNCARGAGPAQPSAVT